MKNSQENAIELANAAPINIIDMSQKKKKTSPPVKAHVPPLNLKKKSITSRSKGPMMKKKTKTPANIADNIFKLNMSRIDENSEENVE